jgi:hypothetical protein
MECPQPLSPKGIMHTKAKFQEKEKNYKAKNTAGCILFAFLFKPVRSVLTE